MSERFVEIDGMHNVRDLGGVRLADGGLTAYGVALRGETVVHLTESGVAQLRQLGVRHVLDLREPDEQETDGLGLLEAAYQRSDVLHESVPLARSSVSTDPIGRVHDAAAVAERYAEYLDNGSFRLAEALARTAWSRSALYVHCAVGKDRTGVVSALLLGLAGADDDAILEDYLLTADRLRAVLLRLGSRPAYAHLGTPDWVAQQPNAEAMQLFLGRLKARGGATHWMLDHGVDSETVALLRDRLRGQQASHRRVG